jgi:hypothetical protein
MRLSNLMISWAAMAVLSGCATFVAPTYSPDYPTIDRLKQSGLDKLAVGQFQPRDTEAPVNRVTLRGAPFRPAEGSFATYLENALRSDLTELRVLDPASTTRVDATLLKNDLDVSGINTGVGEMEVRLTVSRKGSPVLEKIYSARTQFESSFAAAVAVPKAQSEYSNLVRALLQAVYADPAFLAAVKK